MSQDLLAVVIADKFMEALNYECAMGEAFAATKEERYRLEHVIADMMDMGVEFTDERIAEIVNKGDNDEPMELPYFETLNEILNAICQWNVQGGE